MIEVSMWNKSTLYAVSSTDDLFLETTFYKIKSIFSTFLFRVGFLRSHTDKKIFHDLYLLFFFITKWVIVKKIFWNDGVKIVPTIWKRFEFFTFRVVEIDKVTKTSKLVTPNIPLSPYDAVTRRIIVF